MIDVLDRRRLSFTVPDAPMALPRPRVTVVGGHAHAYQPRAAQEAMWRIRQAATFALGGQAPFEGPVRLTVVAYVPMPASVPKRDRETAWPTKRPDLSNFVKLAEDGCSPLWRDDSQVVDLRACKVYCRGSQTPMWYIAVEAAGPL